MASQASISSYFSPPKNSNFIDLTQDDTVNPPPSKRRRVDALSKDPSGSKAKRTRGKALKADGDAFFASLGESAGAVAKNTATKKVAHIRNKMAATSVNRRTSSPLSSSDREDGSHEGAQRIREMFDQDGNARTLGQRRRTSNNKDSGEVGPSGQSWTPFERQVQQLKRDNPDILLLIQDGYKYRFFADDAKIAAKELNIVCYPRRNFLSASIPVERKFIHVKKLLSQGYKVGIVDQQETAALKKVGDNRSGLFKRGITALHTAATFVEDLDSSDVSNYATNAFPSLMCIVETATSSSHPDAKMAIGMLSVVPSTGDVVYDSFEDGPLRTELETRLVHIRPHEMLMSDSKLSKETEGVVKHFTGEGGATGGGTMRIERFKGKHMSHADAMDVVQKFHECNLIPTIPQEEAANSSWLASVVALPQLVVIALAHCIKHLAEFGLANVFVEAQVFQTFHDRNSMLLNGNTVTNLEIFRNQTDFTERGSLLWLLDHTKTKFGSRMLKEWIATPLSNIKLLQERTDAVEEILQGISPNLTKLEMTLKHLPDLGRGLARVQYKKCSPKELATVLTALKTISVAFEPFATSASVGFQSPILNEIVCALPGIREAITQLVKSIDLAKARNNEKVNIWLIPDKFPGVADAHDSITFVEAELQDHLKEVRKILHRPALKYKTVAEIEYLIEVPNEDTKSVPIAWSRESKTKNNTRYHTPQIKTKLQERERYKETLDIEANAAFQEFLGEVSEHYSLFRNVVRKLATADCLLSLAQVAVQSGYVRPTIVEEDIIFVVNGRHPMSEAIRSEPFIPNSITLGGGSTTSKIITGPNMGGKSSFVRMTALLCVMAQIGSYVPAESLTMGVVDAILTRMGASDDLNRGKSTFMIEMSETSDIIRLATSKSLVILDELGRGTSTFDGMAIASSVLQHCISKISCKTLFITHYPLIAQDLTLKYPSKVSNVHMGFIEEEHIDERKRIHFLYTVRPGIASGSFGIECARLSGLPEGVLECAALRAERLQRTIEERTGVARCRLAAMSARRILASSSNTNDAEQAREISELRELVENLLIEK